MTWRVSPEDWLQDFTSVPRSRARAGESLDPVDDQLRLMLRWPTQARLVEALKRRKPASRPAQGHPEPKLVIPSMITSKPRQAAKVEAQPAADPFAALLDPAAPQEPHKQRTTPAQQAAPAASQPAAQPQPQQSTPAPTRRGPRRGPRLRVPGAAEFLCRRSCWPRTASPDARVRCDRPARAHPEHR